MRSVYRALILVSAMLFLSASAQDPIGYASVVVTTHRDYIDPGDGLISLREAINNADPVFDTVRFDASLNGLIITLGDSNGDGIVNYGDDIDSYMPTYAPGEAHSLDINKNIKIHGNGTWNTMISGGTLWSDDNGNSRMDNGDGVAEGVRIFHIDGLGIRVELEGMSMVRGNGDGSDGGAIYVEGAQAIALTIDSCNFQNNTARSGGALYQDYGNATVSIQDSVFDNNYATTNGGALSCVSESTIHGTLLQNNSSDAHGGAVWLISGPRCTIEDSTFNDNRATSDGGAIYNDGRIWGEKLLFSNNMAGGDGGAICAPAESRSSNINSVVFASNDAMGNGGAFYNNGLCTILNGVFSNNSATVDGGGVYEAQYGRSWLTNVTFVQNDAAAGNSGAYCSNAEAGRSTTITNFIMVDNTTTAATELAITGAGTVNLGYGLIDGVDASLTGSTITGTGFANNGGMVDGSSGIAANEVFVSPTDQDGADNTWMTSDDGLRPLMTGPAANVGNDNALVDVNRDGTPEKTIADAVRDANSPFHQGIAGISRTRGTVDLGAYELYEVPDPAGAASVVVTTNLDVVNPVDGLISLREAIANADATNSTVSFDASLNGQVITLGDSDGDGDVDGSDDIDGAGTTYAAGTSYSLDIDKDLTIQGNGSTNTIISGGMTWTDGNSNGAVDWSERATAGLGARILTIGGGNAIGLDGVEFRRGNSGGDGGAIYSGGSDLTVTDCSFRSNVGGDEGAAICSNLGTIDVTGCTFYGNLAGWGGGAIVGKQAACTVNTSTFEKNSARFAGAIQVLDNSSGTISNCTFTQNASVNYGGAVVVESAGGSSDLTITGSTFTSNSAGTTVQADTFGAHGGAISCRQYSQTTIKNTVFKSNVAFDDGAAVHGTDSNSTLAMQNVVFHGNSSQDDDSDGVGDGGALYIEGQFTASVFQGIFYGNQAVNSSGKGGGVYTDNATVYLTNCSFSRNLAADGGGALASIGDAAYAWIDNTVMYADAATANENEVHVTATTDRVSFYYSRIQGYGNPAYVELNWTLNVGASTTALASDPYEDSLDGDGDDNVWRTADDGLIIADASLVDAGRSSSQVDTDGNGVPETALDTLTADAVFGKDITSLRNRIQGSSIAVGAYEVTPDPTGAAVLVVTTAKDLIDPHDGLISLREAIGNASAGNTVTFDASVDGQTILLGDSDGDGDVDANDDIDGLGSTYSAGVPAQFNVTGVNITGNGTNNTIISGGMTWMDLNGNSKLDVGDLYSGGTNIFFFGRDAVALENLTLKRGHASSGGACWSMEGTITLNNCRLTENKSTNGGAIAGGVGAMDHSTFTLDNCLIQNNYATNDGGAISSDALVVLRSGTVLSSNSSGSDGGAVHMSLSADSQLKIDKANFISNTAGNFGGAINSDAPMWIVNAYFAQNLGTAKGGALNAANRCFATSCVFTGNSTLGNGGAISDNNSTSRYTNNTFYNNAAGGAGFGGAIFHNGTALGIYNSVLWGNTAGTGKEVYTFSGAVTVGNSLLEGADSDLSCSTVQTSSGSFVSAGGNIDLATAAADPFLEKADADGADDTPRTADDGLSLAFNYGIVDGGSSNAMVDIDENGTVDSTLASLNGAHATYGFDITGAPNRIMGNTADIGAYEYPLTAETPSTVVTTTDDTVNVYDQVVSLREAITVYANAGDTVTFDASLNGQTIALSSGEIAIDMNLTITGNGSTNTTISAGMVWTDSFGDGRLNSADGYSGGSRIFNVDDGSGAQIDVAVSGLAFKRANGTNGGAVYIANEKLTVTDCLFTENRTTGSGAAIYSLGAELTISGTVFDNSFSTVGAGIYNSVGDTVLSNSTFSRNTTSTAGALYSGSGSIDITAVTFTENESVQGAALVNANGECVVNNCTFSGNTSSNNGIIYNVGIATLANCTISNNSHGLHNTTGTLTLVNSIAWDNSTETSGSVVLRYCIVEGGHTGTNIVSADPILGALADNGGATQTRSLGAGSSAIGAGVMVYRDSNDTIFYEDPNSAGSYKRASDNSDYTPASTDNCLSSTDQRGSSRLVTGRADIGAYERDGVTITFGTATTPSGTGGTLVGSTTQVLDYEHNCTPVTAIVATGYSFVNWTSGGTEVSTDPNITVEDVTADATYTANFALNTYTISTSVTGSGSISPTSATVDHGDNQSFAITPNASNRIVDVLVDGVSVGAVTTYNFINVTSTHTISATFEAIPTYAVTFTADTGGTLTGDTPQSILEGNDSTPVEAIAGAGFHFIKWTLGGSDYSTSNPLTVTNVNADMDLEAVFAGDQAEIEVAYNSTNIPDGSAASSGLGTDFGSTSIGGTVSRTYVVRNLGLATLNLTNTQITGSSDFTITSAPTSTVPAGGFTTLTVVFEPSSHGTLNAQVEIANNDADEGTFTFDLTGTGGNVPPVADGSSSDTSAAVGATVQLSGSGSYDPDGGPSALTYSWTLVSGPMTPSLSPSFNVMEPTFVPTVAGTYIWRLTVDDSAATDQTDVQVIVGDLHTVAATAGTGGDVRLGSTGIPGGSVSEGVVDGGNSSQFYALADAGYDFVQWSDGNTGNPRQFTSVSADISVIAEFLIRSYTVTFTPGTDGSITGTSPQTIAHGGDCTSVTATPDANCHFVKWTLGASDYSTDATITVTNVTTDMALTAVFAPGVPEIGITSGSTTIAVNDTIGLYASTGDYEDYSFIISNSGTSALHLMGTPRVVLAGADAGQFELIGTPADTVAVGAKTSFVIRYKPSVDGPHTATISIANDDVDEAPFTFTLTGTQKLNESIAGTHTIVKSNKKSGCAIGDNQAVLSLLPMLLLLIGLLALRKKTQESTTG